MSDNNISSAPRSSSAANAFAELKKQHSNSTSYNRPSNQSNDNNNDSDNSGCWIFIGVLIVIGLLCLSMM